VLQALHQLRDLVDLSPVPGRLFPLLFWGFIAYLLFSIAKHFFSGKPSEQNDGALDILKNRYASGEIDDQEYTTRKATLSRR